MDDLGAAAPQLKELLERALSWLSAATEIVLASRVLENWLIQFIAVFILVWITIKVIARVYSGDVQNTPLGPIALRAHDGAPGDRIQRIWAPKAILPASMNGLHAYCTFLYGYDDAEGERHYAKLTSKERRARRRWARQFLFEIRDRRYTKNGGEILGRETIDDVESRDVLLTNPDFTPDGVPEIGAATPELLSDWIATQAPRDLQITGTEIISIPDGLRANLVSARERFIQKMARRIHRRRESFIKLGSSAHNRVGAIGYYYIKVSFETSAWFVLFHHPDRDLKMTAWLTVLTSFFGFFLGKMP